MIPSLRFDALVLGAGPAGSTLSIALASAGRQVVLVEKNQRAQHKVCGEFLSPESLPFLRRIGIDPERLGAHPIHSVRVAARDLLAEVALPHRAFALTRRALDEALISHAQQAGVNLLRGYTAEHLAHQEHLSHPKHGWRAQLADASRASISVAGSDVFLATGKHDLRGWPRRAQNVRSSLVALKMYFRLAPHQQAALDGHVEIILYPGGYAGLQLVENGDANLCALITRRHLQAQGGQWEQLLCHMRQHSAHLASRLQGAVPTLDRPLAISSIPYGYCVNDTAQENSPWHLGDQAAVIPSFSGDGMAIAFYTAQRAAQLYLQGEPPTVFHHEIRRRFRRRLQWTTMLSNLLITTPALAHAIRLRPTLLTQIFTATRIPQAALEAVCS